MENIHQLYSHFRDGDALLVFACSFFFFHIDAGFTRFGGVLFAASDYVTSLAPGTVVVVTISDTAIAKKRPMEPMVYDALKQLGLGDDHEVIGYRNPMVFLGAKGLAQGGATLLLDKRAQSKTVLRLDATVQSVAAATTGTATAATKAKAVSGSSSCPVAIQDVKNSTISATEQCPDRAKEGVVFKNCNAVTKR